MKKALNNFAKAIKKYIGVFFSAFPFFFLTAAYEALYLIIMPYHKGMITSWFTEGGGLLGENIIKILYYVLYVLLLCGVLLYISKRDFGFVERNDVIHIILKLLALRCGVDVVNCIFIGITNEIWQSFYNLIFEVLFVTIAVNLISKDLNIKRVRTNVQTVMFLLFFAISFVQYMYWYIEYSNNRIKYSPDGCVYLGYINNLDFRLQMRQLAFMCVWLVTFVCAIYYAVRCTKATAETDDEKGEEESEE